MQVMNLRIQASHAVEDAAVAYLQQIKEKQKADRRAMRLQAVHTETLEAILNRWRFKAGLLHSKDLSRTRLITYYAMIQTVQEKPAQTTKVTIQYLRQEKCSS